MPIFTPPPPFFFSENLRSRAKLEAICWSICVSLLLWKDVDFLEALHIIQWGNVSGGSSSFLQRQQWHSRGQNCKSNFQRCVILILSRSRSAGLYLTVHFVCFRRFSSLQDVWGSWRSIEYPTGKLESILPSQNTKSSFFPRACHGQLPVSYRELSKSSFRFWPSTASLTIGSWDRLHSAYRDC